jgi:hypothetical protein
VGRDWKQWAKCAGIRAVKTMAQTALSMLPVAATISGVNWIVVADVAAGAGVISLITSLAGLPELKTPTESDT